MQSVLATPECAADAQPRTVWQTPEGIPRFTPCSRTSRLLRRTYRLLARWRRLFH